MISDHNHYYSLRGLHNLKTIKTASKSCVDHLILICVTSIMNKMIMITNHDNS